MIKYKNLQVNTDSVKQKILEGWEYERLTSSKFVLIVSLVLCSVFGHKWRDVMYVKNKPENKVCEQCYRCWETKNYNKNVIEKAVSDVQEDK